MTTKPTDAQSTGGASLPLAHRVAVLYLVLPVVVWMLGWFEWWLAAPMAVLIAASLWPVLAGRFRRGGIPSWLDWRVVCATVLVALAWTMASAAGGVLDQGNADWIKHRAVFHDLTRLEWPAHLPDDGTPLRRVAQAENQGDPLLRYSLGYYMVPALAAKALGKSALTWAVPLWTWAGAALLALMFVRSAASAAGRGLTCALILLLFSGMDAPRLALLENLGSVLDALTGGDAGDVPNIESEAAVWRIPLQYSSNTTALFWVPQHFLAAGLGAMLFLRARRCAVMPGVVGVVGAAVMFWSPFAALGLLPLGVALLVQRRPAAFASAANLATAPLLAGLVALYLSTDTAGRLVHGWMWDFFPPDRLFPGAAVFVLSEFVVLAVLLAWLRPALLRDGFFVATTAGLLLLPWYGLGFHNDLGMRASLPLLIVLCLYAAQAATEPAPRGRGALRALVVAALALGSITAAVEFGRAGRAQAWSERAYTFRDIDTEHLRNFSWQYSAYQRPALLALLMRPPPPANHEFFYH